MAVAFVFLLLIVGFGPEGFHDGLGGPFNEGLSLKFVAGVAAVDEVHFTTLFGERGNAAVFLDTCGAVVAGPIRAKKCEEAGGKAGAGSGE